MYNRIFDFIIIIIMELFLNKMKTENKQIRENDKRKLFFFFNLCSYRSMPEEVESDCNGRL